MGQRKVTNVMELLDARASGWTSGGIVRNVPRGTLYWPYCTYMRRHSVIDKYQTVKMSCRWRAGEWCGKQAAGGNRIRQRQPLDWEWM